MLDATHMNRDDQQRRRAKQIILEITKQSSGNECAGNVRLFKIFYFAHLVYARHETGYLSEWPIVKMPYGPGIDRFEEIIGELTREGAIQQESTQIGPYPATSFRATDKPAEGPPLEPAAIEAIRKAVEFTSDKTGAQLSDITHEHSHSWSEAEMGGELNIYIDLVSSKERQRVQESVSGAAAAINEAWK
ncbi:MAG: Panacea domain-containing protein [Thermoguttaceae bacterium]